MFNSVGLNSIAFHIVLALHGLDIITIQLEIHIETDVAILYQQIFL